MEQLTFMNLLIIMSVPSSITGFGIWALKKSMDKRDAKRDKVDEAREMNQILLIKSMGASLALGEATACAIRDGHCNGEVTAALEYAKKIKHEQKDFLMEQGIKNLF